MLEYTDKTLAPFANVIAEARAMHDEDAKTVRDAGTCVMGAGIAVWYKAPRKRNAVRKVLISQAFQGNTASWSAAQRALLHMQANGLEAFWYDGVMD